MEAADGLPDYASRALWRRAHSHLLMLVASMTCLEGGGILPPSASEPLCCGDLEESSHLIVLVEDMICLEGGDIPHQHGDSREHCSS